MNEPTFNPFLTYDKHNKISYIDGEVKTGIDGKNKYVIRLSHSVKKYSKESAIKHDYLNGDDYDDFLNKYCDHKWSIIRITNKYDNNLSIEYDTPHCPPHFKLKDIIKSISFEHDFGNGEVYIEDTVYMEQCFIKGDRQLGRIFIDKKYIIVCKHNKIQIYDNETVEKIKEIEIFPTLLIFTLNNVIVSDYNDPDIDYKYDRDFNFIEKYEL